MEREITIETSCGKTITMPLSGMSKWQILGLIDENPEHELAPLLRAEFEYREKHGQSLGALLADQGRSLSDVLTAAV